MFCMSLRPNIFLHIYINFDVSRWVSFLLFVKILTKEKMFYSSGCFNFQEYNCIPFFFFLRSFLIHAISPSHYISIILSFLFHFISPSFYLLSLNFLVFRMSKNRMNYWNLRFFFVYTYEYITVFECACAYASEFMRLCECVSVYYY